MDSIILTNTNSGTTNNSTLNYRIPSGADFKGKEIALGNMSLYYSWNNITSSYGNNSFSYKWTDSSVNVITMPDGFYTIEDISGYLHDVMTTNKHYLIDGNGNNVYYVSFEENPTYYCFTLVCNPVPSVLPSGYSLPSSPGWSLPGTDSTPQVVFPSSYINTTLGFAAGTYPSVVQSTDYAVNSSLPKISKVSSVNVSCNLAYNKLNQYQNVLYTFSPDVSYASQINITPQNLFFFSIPDGAYNNIIVNLLDQDYNILNLIDPEITLTLLIRDKQKN